MGRYPWSVRHAAVKCIPCNAPATNTVGAEYVCVECGRALISQKRAENGVTVHPGVASGSDQQVAIRSAESNETAVAVPTKDSAPSLPDVAPVRDGSRSLEVSVQSIDLQERDGRHPVVSVVLPTLNEEEGIADCIERIQEALASIGLSYEIIVSDSSTDRTAEIAAEYGARVVEPADRGYGAAYLHGFEHVNGQIVVIGDADMTYDFREIPSLLGPIIDGDADLVLGSRFDGEIKPGAMPALHRYVGNPLLTRFLNVFYDAGVSDAHSGFRAIRRDVLEALPLSSLGMEFASEMVMEASARGFTIREVPITYHARVGEATLDSFQDGWRHVKFMLLNAPAYLFTVPGVIVASLGAIVLLLGLSDVQLLGVGRGMQFHLAGGLLVVVGYQIATLGVFTMVSADPVQIRSHSRTARLIDRFQLKYGATAGLLFLVAGSCYSAYLVLTASARGPLSLVAIEGGILSFVAITLGIQTIFFSLFMSALAELTPSK